MRTRLLLPLLFISLIALLAACATGPRSIEIPREKLQAALERRFPYEARPAGLFTINVAVPRLRLQPEANRLLLDFAVEASDRLSRRSTRGNLAVSFGVRYASSDATVRAVDVRVENIDLEGASGALRAPLQVVGALVAGQLLEGAVLHAFRPEDIAQARGWTPQSLRVTPTGVLVVLVPPGTGAGVGAGSMR
ncbi:MAG: hypothetical protein JWQ76_1286 [Ramlibacter sp.]|nr:hypothetical protein [Ramlibacter sp.]